MSLHLLGIYMGELEKTQETTPCIFDYLEGPTKIHPTQRTGWMDQVNLVNFL